jgi:Sortilin, neurotensin receptor 3,/Secretion system C-terminal sorting domain
MGSCFFNFEPSPKRIYGLHFINKTAISMKFSFRNTVLMFALLLGANGLFAQPWADLMTKGDKESFQLAKDQFKEFWKDKNPEKGKGFKAFLRWEYYWEQRLMPDGSLPKAGTTESNFQAYQAALPPALTPSGTWASMGPTSSTGGYAGIGRLNSIAFDPSNSSIIYAGAAGGGVWKTTNGGTSWSPLTDTQNSLGVSAILVDQSNPNTVYVATGDGDGRDSPSTGILKSTDGGATWSTTGLNWLRSDLRYIRRLLRHPSNANMLVAATSIGMYYSLDAGATWTQAVAGNFFDAEFQPGSTGTFYATAVTTANLGQVFRSTDNAVSWAQVHSLANSSRAAITVSAANANFIGVVYSKSADNGFNGFYSSVDGGGAWSLKASTPNLLGWNATGNDAGGQGWYDLCLVADPTNANTIYLGGVNTWKSTNGGTNWTINTMWTSSGSVPVVHADKHDLVFQNNTTLFQANDGGIYKTTNGGTSWTDLTNTMAISQLYRIGVAQTNSAVIGGLQDNGTKLRSTTGTWADRLGGDGMDCAINPTNANYMYGELYYGDIYRSTNGGSSFSSIKPNTTEQGGWVTPFAIAPSAPATIYLGYKNVFRSTNYGTKWTRMTNGFTGGLNIRALSVAPNNANTVYLSTDADLSGGNRFFRSTNGASSFTTMTNPASAGRINSIAIDNTNANNVWVAVSGYNTGSKVYKSTDGGSTWTNISGTLPNIPANCVTFWNGSNGGIYLGMDVGVYYRDNSMSDWVLFNASLPNVEIADLEIQYSLGKLRAATYGRGVWESDLYGTTPFQAPELSAVLKNDDLAKMNYKVYPNPVQSELSVEFYAENAGSTRLLLIDRLGRQVEKVHQVDVVKGFNKVVIDIRDLPTGVYYLSNGMGKSMSFIKTE